MRLYKKNTKNGNKEMVNDDVNKVNFLKCADFCDKKK